MTADGKEWPEKGVPVRAVKERGQSAQRYTWAPRRSRPFLLTFCRSQCGHKRGNSGSAGLVIVPQHTPSLHVPTKPLRLPDASRLDTVGESVFLKFARR